MTILDDLPQDQRADLRSTSAADLAAELECVGTAVAELEQALRHNGEDDDLHRAGYGLFLERRGAILVAELSRRRDLKRPFAGAIYSREFVMDLKARVDLPTFIVSMHDGTRLRLLGGRATGLCPFHTEDTPSFTVWPMHYHCFGCGEHGDVFDWLLKAACRDWREAVEYVARWLGVPLPVTDRRTVLGAYNE